MTNKLERGYASVENEEYRQGYRDGWRDAMNEQNLDKIEPLRPMQPEEPLRPMNPMKPTPYVPGDKWVQPSIPGWTPTDAHNYLRCDICGLLKSNHSIDCNRPDCNRYKTYTGSWHTRTTDNTSGK